MFWPLMVILLWCLAALPAGLLLGRRLRESPLPE
jgi:hypothetical protein